MTATFDPPSTSGAPPDVTFDTGLRSTSGSTFAGSHWLGPATPVDHRVLDRCLGPVLDVGCGPARHTMALAERGVPALGIDIATCAIEYARPRGIAVLERDLFGRIPGAGRWGTVLLLDGNVGIGGDPLAVLARSGSLVRSGGLVIAELQPPGTRREQLEVCLELGPNRGPWFGWSPLGVDDLADRHHVVGQLRRDELWEDTGRWFLALRRRSDR